MSDFIKLAVGAGVAYWLYNKYSAAPVTAASTTPGAPGYQYIPDTTVGKLTKAAQSQPDFIRNGGKLTADQWQYIWSSNLGKPQIDGGITDALFWPQGRPTNATDYPKMSAADFVAAISTAGLSGLAAALSLPTPAQMGLLRAVALARRSQAGRR